VVRQTDGLLSDVDFPGERRVVAAVGWQRMRVARSAENGADDAAPSNSGAAE